MWVMSPPPRDDPDEALDHALTLANGTQVYQLSDVERAAIHAVYRLYEALLGQPHADLRPASLNNVRPVLHGAYNQVQIGRRLAALRSQLLGSTDVCPYCGFGEPRDLDHYLPRSIYGELAIYPYNLIPSCAPCNGAKRAVVPGLGPAQGSGLIHPYFQVLPDVDFLGADIDFSNGSLSVTFRILPDGIDADLAQKLQFQITRLKLNERYRKQINIFLSSQKTGIIMMHALGPDSLKDFLRQSALSLARSFHRNDWRVALLQALSENEDFCASPELYVGERDIADIGAEAEPAPAAV